MKLNRLQFIGRIGQDAKIVDYQGYKFVTFSVAVDEGYKDGNGNKIERTVWYDCNTEQERFFKVISWLTKGREVLVEGKPSVRVYEKDGKHIGAIRINVQNISLGNSPHDNQQPVAAPAPVARPAPIEQESNDLPF